MLKITPELQSQIETPALLIDHLQLKKNIEQMQRLADNARVKLRPHLKTHKSAMIAKMQLEAGAIGVAVAKLSEAEVMAENGCNDIFIANQITHPLKIGRLRELNRRIDLCIGIDHPAQIDLLAGIFKGSREKLRISIEIDSGLKRCGVGVNNDLIFLAKKISATPFLELEGIFTHAGQVYGAQTAEEVKRIGELEGNVMQAAVELLAGAKVAVKTVSVGSTPTVKYSALNPAVNEIRPGNYVFFDNIQCSLNTCQAADCALYVLATIIAQPAADRVVIDAGSKALGLDLGAHGSRIIKGFGRLVNISGTIERLSEEHGVIILEKPESVELGKTVLIIPNHACAVVNLYDRYYMLGPENRSIAINIDARGRIW